MSFFAAPSEVQNPGDATIQSSNFWPAIHLEKLREVMRLDGNVTAPRLEHAAINAVAAVNQELREWRQAREDEGYETLAAVPAESINNESTYLQWYARAVYCFSRANLIERMRDYDTTKTGADSSDPLEQTVIALRRDARFAIRDILGVTHSTVALL